MLLWTPKKQNIFFLVCFWIPYTAVPLNLYIWSFYAFIYFTNQTILHIFYILACHILSYLTRAFCIYSIQNFFFALLTTNLIYSFYSDWNVALLQPIRYHTSMVQGSIYVLYIHLMWFSGHLGWNLFIYNVTSHQLLIWITRVCLISMVYMTMIFTIFSSFEESVENSYNINSFLYKS